MSFPLWDMPAPVLAVTAHFFEFRPQGSGEELRLAHQLDQGGRYEVVLTTAGGLYRYQLHDLIEVCGYFHQAPLLHFVGKTGQVSDFFGEKLNEGFVAGVMERAFADESPPPAFAILAPEEEPGGFRYVLYLESAEGGTSHGPVWEQTITTRLEQELCSNFHYDYCRRLGQLAPVRLQSIPPGAATRYLEACLARGQRLGNIKPSVLQTTTGWGKSLTGNCEDHDPK